MEESKEGGCDSSKEDVLASNNQQESANDAADKADSSSDDGSDPYFILWPPVPVQQDDVQQPGPSRQPATPPAPDAETDALCFHLIRARVFPRPVVPPPVRQYSTNAHEVRLTKPLLVYKVEFRPSVTTAEETLLASHLVEILDMASIQVYYIDINKEIVTTNTVPSTTYQIRLPEGQDEITLRLYLQGNADLAQRGPFFTDLARRIGEIYGMKNLVPTHLDPVCFPHQRAEARKGFKVFFTFADNKPATLCLQRHYMLVSNQNLMQLWLHLRNDRPLLESFRHHVIGSRVLSKHSGKRYVIQHVYDDKNLRSRNFDGNLSIYAATMAAAAEAGNVVEITNMAQPVLRAVELEGDQVVYLIPELVHQTDSWKDLEADKFGRTRIAEKMSQSADTRFTELRQFTESILRNERNADTAVLGRWNLEMMRELVTVQGTVIYPWSGLRLKTWNVHPNSAGEFSANLLTNALIDAPRIPLIIAIVPSHKTDDTDAFRRKIYGCATSCEVSIDSFEVATVTVLNIDAYKNAMQTQAVANRNVTLFLIALPHSQQKLRNRLISYSRNSLTVAAVTIDSDDMRYKYRDLSAPPTLTHIVAETNGTPWTVDIPIKDVQVAGIYSDRHADGTLFGGVTSSGNCFGTKLKTVVRAVDRLESLSTLVNDLVEQHMHVIAKADDEYRPKLIIYRLSGQMDFEVDEEAEIRAIQAGLFTHRGKESRPKLTYVRVDPYRSEDFVNGLPPNARNPQCGTVFPDEMSNSLYSFHLTGPHKSNTFTNYSVVVDENGIAEADMQKTCHAMCALTFDRHQMNGVPSYCQDARDECDIFRAG